MGKLERSPEFDNMKDEALISTFGMGPMFHNYGTFLQHYCLRKVLWGLGIKAYRFSTNEKEPTLYWYCKRLVWIVFLVPYLYVRRRHGIWSIIRNIASDLFRQCLFQKFYHKHIGDFEEDYSVDNDTILIVGSDQVLRDDPRVWFSEIQIPCKRIVYAGSTDWTQYADDDKWKALVHDNLPKFQFVSVREKVGIDIFRSIIPDVVVKHVVDPVMLAERKVLDSLCKQKSVFKNPTLFCYLVNIDNESDLHLDLLCNLSSALNCDLKICGVQGTSGFVPMKYHVVLGPDAYIRAIVDSQYVITNSFHGLVLSILYHKPFLFIEQRKTIGGDQNLRQNELLATFGLIQHKITFSQIEDVDSSICLLNAEMDGVAIDKRASELREASVDWLRTAIGDDK